MVQLAMEMMTNVVDAASVGEVKRRMAEKKAEEQERKEEKEEEEEEGEVKLRLFVGGLGPSVSISDLEQRFAPLGSVHRIEMIPIKAGDAAAVSGAHRGFAYVEFQASSQASLRKLFSAYNGCKWKGGLLRVEKAKEHYMNRLHREWVAALSEEISNENNLSAVSNTLGGDAMNKQSKLLTTNLSFMQSEPLKIAMPLSKKVKLIPAKGLGKHKRSFQYFPSLPLSDLSREISLQSPSKLSKLDHSEGVQCLSKGLKQQQLDEFVSQADEHAEVDIAIEASEERKRQLKLLSKLFPDDEPREEPGLQPESAPGMKKQLAPRNGVHNDHTKIREPRTKLSVQPKVVSQLTSVPSETNDNAAIDEDKAESKDDPWMEGDESIFFRSRSPSPLGAASDASKWTRLFKAASVQKPSSHSQSMEGVFSGILDDFSIDDSAVPMAGLASLDPHLSGANAENMSPGLKPGSMGSAVLTDKRDPDTDEAVDGDDYSAEESNDDDKDEGVDESEEDSDVDENGDEYDEPANEDEYNDGLDDDGDEDPDDHEDDDNDEDVDKEDENDEEEDEDDDGDEEEGEDEEWSTDVKVVSEANPLDGVPAGKVSHPARGIGVTSSISRSSNSSARESEGKNNHVSVEAMKLKNVTDPKIQGERPTKWVPKSSWNSLIRPDVHPSFSLQNLTSSMKPDKGKTSVKKLEKTKQTPEYSKPRKVLGEKRHRSGGVEGPRSEVKKRSDRSSFLTVAEEEQVASKSKLQVEIKVKHKAAVTTTKKLEGPGSTRK